MLRSILIGLALGLAIAVVMPQAALGTDPAYHPLYTDIDVPLDCKAGVCTYTVPQGRRCKAVDQTDADGSCTAQLDAWPVSQLSAAAAKPVPNIYFWDYLPKGDTIDPVCTFGDTIKFATDGAHMGGYICMGGTWHQY